MNVYIAFYNFNLQIDIFPLLRQNIKKCKTSFTNRNDLQKILLFGEFYRHIGHDISHNLANGIHLINWPSKLFGTLKMAAYLKNYLFYVCYHFCLHFVIKIQNVINRLVFKIELPISWCRDVASTLCADSAEIRYPLLEGFTYAIFNKFQIL